MSDSDLLSLDVLKNELAAFRETGDALHLAHAVRALDDTRDELEEMISHVIVDKPSQRGGA